MSSKTAYIGVNNREFADSHSSSHNNQNHRPSAWTRWTENGWLLELLSMLLGCALLGALCIVLAMYNGKEVPHIGETIGAAITLNTITAIINTATQACMSYALVECLSQLKWSWLLNGAKKLDDIQTFDKASRGLLGSLTLVWKYNVRTPASIGAAVIVGAVAMGPLLQQLISIVSQPVVMTDASSYATVPTISRWAENTALNDTFYLAALGSPFQSDVGETEERYLISAGITGAILNGLYTQDKSIDPMAPACSSGNCTFPPYKSLSVCASVANLTSLITISEPVDGDGYTNFSLNYNVTQNRYLKALYGGTKNLDQAVGIYLEMVPVPHAKREESIAFANVTAPIADIIVLAASPPFQVMAYEFILDWCITSYNSAVVNGLANTSITSMQRNMTANSTSGVYVPNSNYSIDAQTAHLFQQYFEYTFNGTLSDGGGDIYITSTSTQAIWMAMQNFPGTALFTLVDNIAMSMSNFMRSPEAVIHQNGTGAVVNGIVYRDSTIVIIRWWWLVGPAILIICSVLFVLLTMITAGSRTNRPYAWKSSALALLFALDAGMKEDVSGLPEVSQLKAQGQTMVRLVPDDQKQKWTVVRSLG